MENSAATKSEALLRQFWGKSTETESYPAIYHMMDVALVAQQLLQSLSAKEREFALAPFAKSSSPESVYLMFIALHDIGKLTPEFQYMREDILEFDTKVYRNKHHQAKHGATGLQFLVPFLQQRLPELSLAQRKLLVTFTVSHHGKFEFAGRFRNTGRAGEPWYDLKASAVQWLLEQFSLNWQDIHVEPQFLTNNWIAYNAGLCCVADWIGSDKHPERFPYSTASSYQSIYQDRKRRAIKAIAYLNLKVAFHKGDTPLSFEQVFGFAPRLAQKKAEEIASQSNPSMLTIIETEMGSGKTECALYLAERLMQSGHSKGFYIAMPSQATANQLFTRTTQFLQNHPEDFKSVETHLMHGNAELCESYRELQAASVGDPDKQQNLVAVIASSWFCSRKTGLLSSCAVGTIDQLLMAGLNIRHNFVRLFGLAGRTVILDEVHSLDAYQTEMLENLLCWLAMLRCPVVILSATLPKSMRLKLMQAYDNGQVHRENRTGQALQNQDIPLSQIDVPYPRMSWFDNNGKATACSFSPDIMAAQKASDKTSGKKRTSEKQIVLHHAAHHQIAMDMARCVVQHVNEANGQDVMVCILNTVGEAQALYHLLQQQINEAFSVEQTEFSAPELLLFHSRFMLGDKLNIEKEVERLIGPNQEQRNAVNPNRPCHHQGLILIGTQVLEQSLNFDASVMFTACPPIDLLLQRMGRLHRFVVNDSVRHPMYKTPKMHTWLADYQLPNKRAENGQEAINQSDAYDKFGASGLIYPEYILTQTASFLRSQAIERTLYFDAVRDMDLWIESVYGDVSHESTDSSENLWEQRFMYRNEMKTMAMLAGEQLFKGDEDTEHLITHCDNFHDEDNIKISTRLATRSVTLIFVKQQQDQKDEKDQKQWLTCFDSAPCLLSSQKSLYIKNLYTIQHLKRSGTNISNPFWVDYFTAETYHPKMWQQHPEQKLLWQKTALLYGCVVVCVDEDKQFHDPTIGKLWLEPDTGLNWQLNNKEGGDGINAV